MSKVLGPKSAKNTIIGHVYTRFLELSVIKDECVDPPVAAGWLFLSFSATIYEMTAKQDRERMGYNAWDSDDIIQTELEMRAREGDAHAIEKLAKTMEPTRNRVVEYFVAMDLPFEVGIFYIYYRISIKH